MHFAAERALLARVRAAFIVWRLGLARMVFWMGRISAGSLIRFMRLADAAGFVEAAPLLEDALRRRTKSSSTAIGGAADARQ